MKLDYILSKLAIEDLESIWYYTAEKWSVDQANMYYQQIIDGIDAICLNPESGKSIKEIKEQHRSISVKSHLLIYKIENHRILIDRILHQKMVVENKLND